MYFIFYMHSVSKYKQVKKDSKLTVDSPRKIITREKGWFVCGVKKINTIAFCKHTHHRWGTVLWRLMLDKSLVYDNDNDNEFISNLQHI